jgi:peptidyl-tRNA hydrolase, PTH1 family
MRLFVGLGNPEPRYRYNRHNVGFLAVEAIAERSGFPEWRSAFGSAGSATRGILDGEEIVLLKPMTFMNGSGRVVREAVKTLRLSVHDILVFHDEIEVLPALVKMRVGGGSRGHNGLRSVSDELRTVFRELHNDYHRVCIGVGRPKVRFGVDDYVLSNFMPDETPWVGAMLDVLADNARLLATRRDRDFLERVNRTLEAKGFTDAWRRHRLELNQPR